MEIYIVITNWNGAEDTIECVESIEQLKLPKNVTTHIVVVDNASTDNSVEELSRIQRIHLIKNSKNLGFTGGYNTGIEYVLKKKCDFIWLLNPDLRLDKNSLTELLKKADEKTILSPKIYFY